MDAGHFDTKTAYAAANTLRLDDMNPHFWRTHDGGKTWTEIDNGIAGGAVANSIREDPRKKGLLYAATDTQVWVSIRRWRSTGSPCGSNMPAISVRDIEVKDDASCLCSDLVAGTHGRGFWILDDVTPLRQAAEAAAASQRVSVQAGDRHPHPLRHQRSHALAAGTARRRESARPARSSITTCPSAASEVKLEILNAAGQSDSHLFQHRSGAQSRPGHRSGGLQQDLPADAHRARLRSAALLARAAAGIESQPPACTASAGTCITIRSPAEVAEVDAAAVAAMERCRIAPTPASIRPGSPPGTYTVRLTANGETLTQPITIKMDPRVKITPEVQQIFTLTTQMEDNARNAAAAYKEARDLAAKVKARTQSAANDALLKQIEEIAPAEVPGAAGGGRGGRGGGGGGFGAPEPATPPNLANLAGQMIAAVMAMQSSEMPPTAAQLQACSRQTAAYTTVMAKWAALKAPK